MWRYNSCERIEIDAPVEQVYAIASDPEMVPRYAPEIRRIEVVQRERNATEQQSLLVRSYFTVGGRTFPTLYRYVYRAPRHYSGIQVRGSLLRGYFRFSFTAQGDGTIVSHCEGMLSRVPGLAQVAGLFYFRLLSRGGIEQELRRLKALVEGRANTGQAMPARVA